MKESMLEYIKTCPMTDIYPETARVCGLKGVYHHFRRDNHTYSYPVVGAEFETPGSCMRHYYKHEEVKK